MGHMEVIVLDTHILIWWLSNPEKLSSEAAKAIRDAGNKDKIFVSAISVWELAMLIAKGRLALTMDVRDWVYKVESMTSVHFVPVNNDIALRSVWLPGELHNDPADRIIIATAMSLNAALVTSDEKIRAYSHVKII